MKRLFHISLKHSLALVVIVAAAVIGYEALSTADSPGQIAGGNIYQAKNLTTGSGYADPQSASACQELKYDIQLHNPDFGQVDNLLVKVNLPAGSTTSNTSTMTATYTGGTVNSVSDTATVNLDSSQSLTYESGTTQLFDANGNLVKTLPDTITSSGVNLGSLAGSGLEYVNFNVKVSCPTTPPPTPVFTCDELGVSVGDNRTVTITTFNTTAKNGASFKNADIAWGDNTTDSGLNPVVGKSHTYAADGTYTITATAHFDVSGQDETATSAGCTKTITIKTPAAPVFSCDELDLSAGDNRTATITTFNVTAQNGATFKNADINWGDGKTDTGLNPVVGKTHQYGQDGTFTVTATAHFDVNGQDKTASSPGCMKTVQFTTPAGPVFTCNNLTITAGDNRTVTVSNFATTAQNGATFKNVVIDWGDNSSRLTATSPVGKTHQYAQNGTFTIQATAHFTVNGKDVTATSPNCTQLVTFQSNQPPIVTPPPTTTVVIPGGTTTIATTTAVPAAVPAETTELVNTGPGSLAGIFVGTSILGGLGYRRLLQRRLGKQI